MKKFLSAFFGNGFVIGFLSLVGAGVAMALLFYVFDNAWEEDPGTPELLTGEEAEELPALPVGNSYQFSLNGVPAPFLEEESGNALGYVFLDIAFEVTGERARSLAEARRAEIATAFSERLKREGAGSSAAPGVVDIPRLEAAFKESAESLLGPGAVAGVSIAVEEQGGG